MESLTLTPELLERVSKLLAEHAGLHFDATKQNTLQAHLKERTEASQCGSLAAYLSLIADPKDGREELGKLVEAVTIHETSFFRNREHYRALSDYVLADLARRNAEHRKLRIWSAGCSTGEEAYSLAITCLEHPMLRRWEIKIEASDLCDGVLALAKRGIYRAPALRYVEPERVRRWFTPQAGEIGRTELYKISDQARSLVKFRPVNLSASPFPAAYKEVDLIFCENVIIYLKPEVTRGLIERFYDAMRPGGYLFLGYSETLWQVSERFRLIAQPKTFYYQRPESATPAPSRSASQASVDARRVPRKPASRQQDSDADLAQAIAMAEQLTRQGYDDLEAGRYAEAQTAFSQALERNPASVRALLGLAQIHANQGSLAEAQAECAKALELDALCEEAHLLAALLYLQQGKADAAIDHFEKLLFINYDSVAGHFHLAELHRSRKRDKEAAEEYRRTLWALDRHSDATISGIPAATLRRTCEERLRRIRA